MLRRRTFRHLPAEGSDPALPEESGRRSYCRIGSMRSVLHRTRDRRPSFSFSFVHLLFHDCFGSFLPKFCVVSVFRYSAFFFSDFYRGVFWNGRRYTEKPHGTFMFPSRLSFRKENPGVPNSSGACHGCFTKTSRKIQELRENFRKISELSGSGMSRPAVVKFREGLNARAVLHDACVAGKTRAEETSPGNQGDWDTPHIEYLTGSASGRRRTRA